jgi:DNA-directed RNA polymerase alpha subunit
MSKSDFTVRTRRASMIKCPNCGYEEPEANQRNRNLAIVAKYHAEDVTLADLADEFGVSRERVRQILGRAKFEKERKEVIRASYRDFASIEDVRLDVLDIPVRVYNCLHAEGFETVGNVLALESDAYLLRLPNFGGKSLRDWHLCLASLAKHFGTRKKEAAVISDEMTP